MNRRAMLAGGLAGLVGAGSAQARGTAIDEQGFVPIGGIDQWVALRGADRARPVILFLHGGPAEAQSPFRDVFAPWEQRFVVAQWDQRGAGLTHQRSPAASAQVTTDHLVADGLEVAANVAERLGRRRIVLAGHSWGTVLGALMVRRRPDLFSAFVATGLEVSWPDTVAAQYRHVLAAARAAGNAAAIAQLEDSGSPAPADFAAQGPMRRWLTEYLPATDRAYLDYQRRRYAALSPPLAAAVRAGGQISIPRLLPTIIGFDARRGGNTFPVPLHLIQGRDDWFTPTALAADYVRGLSSPHTSHLIEGGHFAYATNAEAFARTLQGLRL